MACYYLMFVKTSLVINQAIWVLCANELAQGLRHRSLSINVYLSILSTNMCMLTAYKAHAGHSSLGMAPTLITVVDDGFKLQPS